MKTLKPDLDAITAHRPEAGRPHWSETIDWRPGRWDPLSNAPIEGYPILHVRGRDEKGNLLEPMHYAYGDGDGLMPPFRGWFVPSGERGFQQVHPVEWQPLRASPDEPAKPVSGEGPERSLGMRHRMPS